MRTLLLTLLIGLSPWCMAAQIYKWVDAQGVTHFGCAAASGSAVDDVTDALLAPAQTCANAGQRCAWRSKGD